MDWKKLADKAKDVVDKRGGPESAKQDAEELRDIAQGQGTMSDKLKAAAQAIKEPGAHGAPAPGQPGGDPKRSPDDAGGSRPEG